MKKNKISFDTGFWSSFVTGNPFKAIDSLFDFADLDYYKQNLTEVLIYSYKTKVCQQDNPSGVFVLYTVIKSLLKVCYCLKKKRKKWKVKDSLHSETVLHLSSLTKEEYDNPFIVFQNAFDEKTLEEFQLFLCLILELSLSPRAGDPDTDLTTPYIHLTKMLDAVALIKERGVEKIRNKVQMDCLA
ncbi:hypothetical protein [Flavobacterium aquidurense]|uniref:Uncharacterized protein n=1 Tax=Flavobacterium aquidurense TaxID=362413 RepID=A0A0Q0SDZ0_9FLAO|nr:hypothetical protein [Flavobacterium aquidurense]KQB42558.1 hypothetical protein RC62_3565 [Flavobacterium aquidurense]